MVITKKKSATKKQHFQLVEVLMRSDWFTTRLEARVRKKAEWVPGQTLYFAGNDLSQGHPVTMVSP